MASIISGQVMGCPASASTRTAASRAESFAAVLELVGFFFAGLSPFVFVAACCEDVRPRPPDFAGAALCCAFFAVFFRTAIAVLLFN
jgi:hypothetical protein